MQLVVILSYAVCVYSGHYSKFVQYIRISVILYGSTYSRNGPNVPYMQYKMFTFVNC